MRTTDIVTLQVYDGDVWIDYTDGLLDAVITRGVQTYSGPLTQPDVGQLTLISRNPNLDPYNNELIKYNAYIRINANGTRIFTGKIEGINVDYQPAGDPPIVTITAIDMIGTMYKHVLSDSLAGLTTTTSNLFSIISNEIDDFDNIINLTEGTSYASNQISEGDNAWDVLASAVKTDTGFIFANSRNEVEYYRLDSDNPIHPYNARPISATYDYDGNGESYQRISLSDGFERIVNEVVMTTTDGQKITSRNDYSIELWGKSSATFEPKTANLTYVQNIANVILQESSEPFRDIYNITWKSNNKPDIAKDIDLFNNIYISHRINETTTIERKYSVIGIKHEINALEWITTYTLRNFSYQASSIPNPVLSVTPPTGTINTTFQFDYTHPNPELIVGQLWDLDDGFTATTKSATANYSTNGGKEITLTITTVYGYTKSVNLLLSVAAAPPVASFSVNSNSDNLYTFTFTGQDATSYLWEFGDGTTSTLQSPTKYYADIDAGGELLTVTLTATNSQGSDVATYTATFERYKLIPVKYVRLRFTSGYGNGPTSYKDLRQQNMVSNMPIRNISFGTPNPEFTIEDFIEFNGFMTYDQYNLDTYGRHKRATTGTMLSALRYGTATLYPFHNVYSATDTNIAMSMILNLNGEYTNLGEIKFETNASSEPINWFGKVWVDVSFNTSEWYNYGYMSNYDYGSPDTTDFTYTGTAGQPPKWTLPLAPSLPNNTPIRYIKFRHKQLTANAGCTYYINEIIPVSGEGLVNTGTFTWTNSFGTTYTYNDAIDDCFGLGAINTGTATGARLDLARQGDFVIKSYLPPSTTPNNITTSQTNLTHWNQKNTGSALEWEETEGETDFVFTYDFGQLIQKLRGFYIDLRKINGTYTSTCPTDNYALTIYISQDNTNWTSLGEFSLSPGSNTGAIRILSDTLAIQSGSTFTNTQVQTQSQIPLSS